ncbi:MAG: type II toxin-antitoxin system RelE/ParE family toxin [Alphaproteobacteria bacterium]|nr:type II toxin-antitoxin system RelE/ParE family toxin [Alphaproteobacteria bacterium]MBU1514665.1 type II toxin-antitoxin system RelE/ParE family toxin [Alphaproteobacteria bacterium]MBU2093524.1 type II toxin-antitoxin system RelE/ParE family toxin [Alphaproteobacteria bacterium]MBU2149778.1 type II toxin-antitoxin system RelE/ParE family toxin [Alphaproteobacteria bacterium]MBU2305519.1 type II toxin-antitoxin system RelE/ParE family toxin [Alphaproteobacteria bacterium]
MAFRLSLAARQDIVDIYLHSENAFGEAQADRYLADLESTFAFLADHPFAARQRVELTPPVRIHPYRAHVIVYRLDGDDILILRLRHGREDWHPSPAGS